MIYNDIGLYVPSIDAKDLYLASHNINANVRARGYTLRNYKKQRILKKFINTFDNSLDLEELIDVYKKQCPDDPILYFTHNGKKYTDRVINVTFKYSVKEFNKAKENTFLRVEYQLNQVRFIDCIARDKDNEIVGIITEEPVRSPISDEELPKGFVLTVDKNGHVVYRIKNLTNICNVKQLRELMYKKGFYIDRVKYVRFKRSSGSARTGKCLFIDERFYQEMHKWEMCSLDIPIGSQVDLAALEAYIALPTSSIIGKIQIDPKSIAVIPDWNSKFTDDCIVTEIGEDGWLHTEEKNIEVSNSVFDGQSLIDKSAMGEFQSYGMILLRNRFFKSCCFNTNLQQWFQDNGITEISQLHPDVITLADKIEDIKIITTPNSIKYAKFAPIEQWLKNIRPDFGVVKHEKPTHFFDGEMVQAHYQLLNTLQFTEDEVAELIKPSLDYVSKLNTDIDVLRHHIKADSYAAGDTIVMPRISLKTKNEIVYTMLTTSSDFKNTKIFYNFKQDLCRNYRANIKKGHILISGNYSVLFGNPYEMLLHSIGRFDGTSTLPPGNIHTIRYPFEKKLLGCRSPHISTSNLLVANNMRHDQIDKYFNLTKEIVCINSINENILERLSGADQIQSLGLPCRVTYMRNSR